MIRHVFGPVPSRRLGRSLGVDLTPFKTCTYDCIYCQLGRTTCKTTRRQEWFSVETVIAEVEGKLADRPDYITLSGSGEPTLYAQIGTLIKRIKAITDIPVAVLTNGSLLGLSDVRQALLAADVVAPSLDAGCPKSFHYVNRPHPDITFDVMLEGLQDFRSIYQGRYWLETMIIGGVTSMDDEVVKLSHAINRLAPDRLQVNTVVRPPAETFALPVSSRRLHEIAGQLHEQAEVIADFGHVVSEHFAVTRDEVLGLLRRRPCTAADIAKGLGLHHNEVVKYVEELLAENKIRRENQNQQTYYKHV